MTAIATATPTFAPCTCRLGSAFTTRDEACQMIQAGMAAPLSITNKNGETKFYWLAATKDGYRFFSDDEPGLMYDVPADLAHCQCPDHKYRKTACKHIRVCRSLKTKGLIP